MSTGDGTTPTTASTRGPWSRLLRVGAPRATRANAVGAVLAVSLGFAIAAQVQSTQAEGLEGLRTDELWRILDDVTQNNQRLADEIRDLEEAKAQLESGVGQNEAALQAAQARLDTYSVLAGVIAATGPGVTVTIADPEEMVRASLLLETIEELRNAGAEALEVNDVRIVASTWFADAREGLRISGQVVTPPYLITALGDAQGLASAMEIPGGVTESVRRVGAEAVVEPSDALVIDALHETTTPRYARPVAPSESP